MNVQFFQEHWFSLGVGAFLLCMTLYGHRRGFLKMALSIAALILTLLIVKVSMPYMTGFIRHNTSIPQMVEQGILKMTGMKEGPETEELPAGQRKIIEDLSLPEQMKRALIENNNYEVYQLLGVEAFVDYVGMYLSNMVLNAIGSVLLFIVVYVLLRFLIKWLDLLARLPVLAGINQLAGALLGAAQGLLLIWVFFLVVTACSETTWGSAVTKQISESPWLLFLYHNNIFNKLFLGILSNLG